MKSQYYHYAVTGSQNTFNESPGKSVFVSEKSIAKAALVRRGLFRVTRAEFYSLASTVPKSNIFVVFGTTLSKAGSTQPKHFRRISSPPTSLTTIVSSLSALAPGVYRIETSCIAFLLEDLQQQQPSTISFESTK